MMKVVITKNKMPLSWLIRFFLNEKASHIAFVFDEKFVIHSNLRGVHLRWWSNFRDENTIVDSFDLEMDLKKEENVFQSLMDAKEGKPYDYMGFIYFSWRAMLFKLFKKPLPGTNPLASSNAYICTEIAESLREWGFISHNGSFAIVTPSELFEMFKSS